MDNSYVHVGLCCRNFCRGIKWSLRCFCGSHALLLPLYFKLFHGAWFKNIYQPDPDIVIEGFGGSANSFAVYAFESAQDLKIKIAHHLHVTGQIKWAVKKRCPVVVIIRNPADAVASLLSRDYYPSAKAGLIHYARFYYDIIPIKDRVVVATFKQLTSDYSEVIYATNRKFGTQYHFSEDMHEKGLECLKNEGRNDTAAMPSKAREDRKNYAVKQVEALRDTPCWRDAFLAYNKMLEGTT